MLVAMAIGSHIPLLAFRPSCAVVARIEVAGRYESMTRASAYTEELEVVFRLHTALDVLESGPTPWQGRWRRNNGWS